MGIGIPCLCFGAYQCFCSVIVKRRGALILEGSTDNGEQTTDKQTTQMARNDGYTREDAPSCTEPVCLLHYSVTRHLIVETLTEFASPLCFMQDFRIVHSKYWYCATHSVRSCMLPSAFLQPCTFCSWSLRPTWKP